MYSEWPTIPQVYVKGEFIGGCDLLTSMYRSGELREKLIQVCMREGPYSNLCVLLRACGLVSKWDLERKVERALLKRSFCFLRKDLRLQKSRGHVLSLNRMLHK